VTLKKKTPVLVLFFVRVQSLYITIMSVVMEKDKKTNRLVEIMIPGLD